MPRGKTPPLDKGPWGEQMRENVPQDEAELRDDEGRSRASRRRGDDAGRASRQSEPS